MVLLHWLPIRSLSDEESGAFHQEYPPTVAISGKGMNF